ncbi:MAG: PQQ-binding-like beta-propeller repeat protein, partial [Sedimentisphaerales bacterium]
NRGRQIDDILGVKSMKRCFLLSVLITMLGVCNVWADWPQYLGPNRNAISDEKGLLRSWPAEGPKVLWTFDLGPGYGGGAISKGKVYLLDRVAGKQDVFRCIDLNSGKELWSFAYDAPGRLSHQGSRSTPAIDGKYVYTCGCFGDVYCFDQTTQKPVWKKNVWKDYGGGRLPNWGISQNPLIYGDMLILASQTEKAGVVAYDKTSGKVKWVSPALPGRAGYVTPAVVNIDGQDQLVMITATSRRERGGRGGRGGRSAPAGSDGEAADGVVLGMDIKDGKTLWTYKGWQCRIPVNNVVPVGDGRLFISGGYMAGSAMIKVTRKEGGYDVKELYTTQDFGTHVHPSILYKGHFYGHGTTNSRRDSLTCMSVDGKLKWKTGRDPVFDKGGFILVGDLMLSVDGKEGILYLIEPDSEGFKKLASVDLLDTNECWGPLSLSDGKLLIRDQKQMKCVAVR